MTSSPSRSTSTYAIISLISGILGWTLLPLLGSVLAIVLGHMARTEIRRSPDKDGDGLAVSGLVLGYVSLVIMVLSAIAILLFIGGSFAFIANTTP